MRIWSLYRQAFGREMTWQKSRGSRVGERGGVVVNDRLETSDSRIYADWRIALHSGNIYGLVAPGYEMAEIVGS